MKNGLKIIERNNNFLLYRFAFTHLFTIIFYACGKVNSYTLLATWALTVLLPNFIWLFTRNLKAIEIGENKLLLVFNIHFKEVIEIYGYHELKFTNRVEMGGKGSLSKEFRIYKVNSEKSLISLGNMMDGWTSDKITEIVEELERLEIKVTE